MSSVLIDSSVWVEVLRGKRTPETEFFRRLTSEALGCTHGLIRAEVLSGAKSRADWRKLSSALSALAELSDPPLLWDRVADARFRLARKGIPTSTSDVIVACVAILHRKALYTLDKDFERFTAVLPLRLVHPTSH